MLLAGFTARAQYIPPVEEDVKARLAEWQDLKFGMFIHWGAYSQWGVVESNTGQGARGIWITSSM